MIYHYALTYHYAWRQAAPWFLWAAGLLVVAAVIHTLLGFHPEEEARRARKKAARKRKKS